MKHCCIGFVFKEGEKVYQSRHFGTEWEAEEECEKWLRENNLDANNFSILAEDCTEKYEEPEEVCE